MDEERQPKFISKLVLSFCYLLLTNNLISTKLNYTLMKTLSNEKSISFILKLNYLIMQFYNGKVHCFYSYSEMTMFFFIIMMFTPPKRKLQRKLSFF